MGTEDIKTDMIKFNRPLWAVCHLTG